MAISFECRACGGKLKAPEDAAGRSLKCPDCGAVVLCPAAEGSLGPARRDDASHLADLNDPKSYGLVEPELDPYAPPKAPREALSDSEVTRKIGTKYRARVRKVAVAQQGILIIILLQFVSYSVAIFVPPRFRIFPAAFTILLGIASLYFMFSLAKNLYSTLTAIFLCVLTIIPCIGLLVLLSMNGRATEILREAGHEVGFMGADLSKIPSE